MLIEPRFLAVAVEEKEINRRQAWRIYESQSRLVHFGIPKIKSGEIAVILRILTQDKVNEILKKLVLCREKFKKLIDPVAKPPLPNRIMDLSTPNRKITGIIFLLFLSTIAWRSRLNWSYIAITGTILCSAWLIINLIWPKYVEGRLVWYRFLRRALLAIATFSVFHAIFNIIKIQSLDITNLSYIKEIGRWYCLLGELSIIIVCGTFWITLAIWRHKELKLHELRINLTEMLVALTCKVIAHSRRKVSDESRESYILTEVKALLKLTARIMSLNIWVRAAKRIIAPLSANKAEELQAITIWYLVPNEKYFNIKLFEAPDAPSDVIEALKDIQADHHPVYINQERVSKAVKKCVVRKGKKRKISQKKLLDYPDREEFISLTGYIYSHKTGFPSVNPHECFAFNHHHVEVVKNLTERVARWLYFRAISAYPVFKLGHEDTDNPIGILMANRCIQNGITPEDQDLLATLSCLLGIILSELDTNQDEEVV